MSTPFASPAAQAATASLPVFPRPSAADFDAPGACMPLPQFGVIDVAGDDAATFLHSQLTNDIEHLDAASARLSGYCSAKGRLLASFLAWRAGHGVQLLVSKDVQAAVQKRLSMFVLRAKAKLTDASDTLAVVGFAGDVREALSGIFDALPDGVHVKVDGPAGALIRVPDAAGRKRYLWIGPRAEVDARLAALGGKLPSVSPAVWDWLDVRAGEPRITQPAVEQFVPQMVNFDVIGAVNFRKGCYPGQEVVARSQYRGTTKRRTFLFDCDAVPLAGQDVFASGHANEPAGTVANAAPHPLHAGGSALVEVRLAAITDELRLGAADGALLTRRALPYSVPLDAAVAS